MVSTYPADKWWNSSVGMMFHSQYDGKVIKFMFQTTNQVILCYIVHIIYFYVHSLLKRHNDVIHMLYSSHFITTFGVQRCADLKARPSHLPKTSDCRRWRRKMASKGLFWIEFLLGGFRTQNSDAPCWHVVWKKISLGFNYNPWDPCMPYMVTWIPSIYPLYVSINLPAPWIRHG